MLDIDYYNLGMEYFNNNDIFKQSVNIETDIYHVFFNEYSKIDKISHENAIRFSNGFNQAKYDYWYEKLKVKDFIVELKDICLKYKVDISFGCGCCGAGLYVNDLYIFENINVTNS